MVALFSALGRSGDALPVAEEAVSVYSELANTDSDRYRPKLATAMTNLSELYWALGRAGEALPVTRETVTLYRDLAELNADRYRPKFAQALNNLGSLLDAQGAAQMKGCRSPKKPSVCTGSWLRRTPTMSDPASPRPWTTLAKRSRR